MGGWLLFAAIGAAAALALSLLRFPLVLKTFAAAALMLGAAGYAWQGQPGNAGHPIRARDAANSLEDETIVLRNAMFGRFGTAAAYLTPSDAMMRYGAPDAAARMLQGGINRDPANIALWTQLGTVIATRDGSASPAALFAFRRAIALAPRDPGPWFFLGMAKVRGGDFAGGQSSWQRAYALAPAAAPYRGEIATRLALLDYFLANNHPAAPTN